MISIPRHDLALALGAQEEGVTPYLQKRAGDRLRALLAKPAAESKPDPIIAVLKSNLADGVMPSFSGGDLKHLIKLLESAPEPATKHQSEPVAWRVQRITPTGNHRLDRPLLTLATPEEWGPAWKAEPLYTRPAEQPAPVAAGAEVFWVSKEEFDEVVKAAEAELDEVARLNPPQQ